MPQQQPSAEGATARLIPDQVIKIAGRVADGSLTGKSITVEFQIDDENIALFLKRINDGNDEKTLEVLCGMLRFNPKILQNPLVFGTVYGLYQNPFLWRQSPGLAEKWVAEVSKAIAEGLTHGWSVEVTKPSVRRQGRPPVLFPHLYERDGWMPTADSMEDARDLYELLKLYEDLHERLRNCDNWKALSAEFRDHPTEVVEERAFDTEEVFDQFKAEHRWAGRILSKADYHRMVHDSFLEVIKNNSPRHALTCELLATLRYNRAPELDITASLIHSSIALAKKHRKQLANI
jgi:hypothetical protein